MLNERPLWSGGGISSITSAKNRLSCAVGIRLRCSRATWSTRSSRRSTPSPRCADSIVTGAQVRKWNVSLVSSRERRLRGLADDEIGLVERDHERAAGLLDHAGDPASCSRGPGSASITSTTTSARVDLTDRHRDRESSRSSLVDPRLAADPGGVDEDVVAAADRERRLSTGSVVVPAHVVDERALLAEQAVRQRRLAGVRAADERDAQRASASAPRGLARARRRPRSRRVERARSKIVVVVAGLRPRAGPAPTAAVTASSSGRRCRGRARPRPATRRRGRARGSRGPGHRRPGDRSC